MRNILAIDVGFSNMGFAVVNPKRTAVDCGVFVTEKSAKKTTRVADDYATRSGQLAKQIAGIIHSNEICGIVAELPSGGAQNAKAIAQMNMATAILSSVASLLNVPCEWTTPSEVKRAMTGNKTASKNEIMESAIRQWGGKIVNKQTKCKKSVNFPDGERTNSSYFFCNKFRPACEFEHIADALGAYMALSDSVLIRMSAQ